MPPQLGAGGWVPSPRKLSAASTRPAVDRLFFFSSRRRHTRLTCDWSSDVCSSDLGVHLDEAVVDRFLRVVEQHFEDAEPFVDRFEEGAVAVRAALRFQLRLLAFGEIGRASCRERV